MPSKKKLLVTINYAMSVMILSPGILVPKMCALSGRMSRFRIEINLGMIRARKQSISHVIVREELKTVLSQSNFF